MVHAEFNTIKTATNYFASGETTKPPPSYFDSSRMHVSNNYQIPESERYRIRALYGDNSLEGEPLRISVRINSKTYIKDSLIQGYSPLYFELWPIKDSKMYVKIDVFTAEGEYIETFRRISDIGINDHFFLIDPEEDAKISGFIHFQISPL